MENVTRYLATGESPSELLEVLRRRQLIEPLPDFAHEAVARLLSEPSPEAPEAPEKLAASTAAEVTQSAEVAARAAPLMPPPSLAVRPDSLAAPSLAVRPAPPTAPSPSLTVRPAPLSPVPAPPAPPSLTVCPAPLSPAPAPSPPPSLAIRPAPLTPPQPPLSARSQPLAAVRAAIAPLPDAIRMEEAVEEHKKTVARPRHAATFREPQVRSWVTPPRQPIETGELFEPAEPQPAASAPLPASQPPPATPGAAIDADSERLFADFDPLEEHAAPRRPTTRKRRAIWLGAALLVLFIAWLYGRPSITTPAAGTSIGKLNRALMPAAPAAPAVEPGSTFQDCPTCPKMTVLPAGRFKQGSARENADASPAEKPQHIVLIHQPLAFSTNEVTVGNFREFATATKRDLAGCEVYDGEWRHKSEASWLNPGFSQNADHPVTCVSWQDAVAYADWLSARTGHRYRLPSSSEWEYAARAGVDAALPWSPAMQAACEHANVADRSAARRYPKWSVFVCKDGYVNTAPVASFKANAFGVNDMLGNVAVWTQDCWHDDYSKAPIDGSARMDGNCAEHEIRGSSWFSSPAFVGLSHRSHSASTFRSSSIGVRLVREL